MAAGEQLVGVRGEEVQALGLAVRPARAADVGPFVPVEAEPAQVLENALLGLPGRALGVGVLDAQDEGAVVAAREQPVEERGARVADVQLPGGAGREADSHVSTRRPRSDVRRPSERHRVGGDRLATADGIHAFVCLAFQADARRVDAQRVGQARAHLLDRILDLRALEDHRDVHVGDLEALRRAPCARPRASSARLSAPFHLGSVSGK